MKYIGRLVLVAQAMLMAGWVSAGTVTVNGLNCGSALGNVTVSVSGDITVNTTDQTSCAPGSVNPGGPYTVQVNRSGNGALGVVTGTGIDCGGSGDCTEILESGSSITLTATEPSGTDTFTWGGACSGSDLTCMIPNITSNKTVSATYNAAGTTVSCPSGVTCTTRPWPTIVQETVTMKGNAVLAIKINTTAAGVSGLLSTMYTTGTTATREVALSSAPGDFAVTTRCLKTGLEVTSSSWQQQGSDRVCQLPANSTAWVNIRFTNCPSTSNCSFYLKSF